MEDVVDPAGGGGADADGGVEVVEGSGGVEEEVGEALSCGFAVLAAGGGEDAQGEGCGVALREEGRGCVPQLVVCAPDVVVFGEEDGEVEDEAEGGAGLVEVSEEDVEGEFGEEGEGVADTQGLVVDGEDAVGGEGAEGEGECVELDGGSVELDGGAGGAGQAVGVGVVADMFAEGATVDEDGAVVFPGAVAVLAEGVDGAGEVVDEEVDVGGGSEGDGARSEGEEADALERGGDEAVPAQGVAGGEGLVEQEGVVCGPGLPCGVVCEGGVEAVFGEEAGGPGAVRAEMWAEGVREEREGGGGSRHH